MIQIKIMFSDEFTNNTECYESKSKRLGNYLVLQILLVPLGPEVGDHLVNITVYSILRQNQR